MITFKYWLNTKYRQLLKLPVSWVPGARWQRWPDTCLTVKTADLTENRTGPQNWTSELDLQQCSLVCYDWIEGEGGHILDITALLLSTVYKKEFWLSDGLLYIFWQDVECWNWSVNQEKNQQLLSSAECRSEETEWPDGVVWNYFYFSKTC